MNRLIIALVFLYTSDAVLLSQQAITNEWINFKINYATNFSNNEAEEMFRENIFANNLQDIEDHNERYRQGLETYKVGINQFSIYTDEEIAAYTTGIQIPFNEPEPLITISPNSSQDFRAKVPSSLDWRARGAVTPVKNQGSCGSCWAFATTGALEAHHKIKRRSTVTLSEQQLVDCDKKSHGCNGGWMPNAYHYIKTNGGINLDRYYPYQAKNSPCRYNRSKPKVTIRGHAASNQPITENALKNIIATKGPVSVAINAKNKFHQYKSGVYYDSSCTASNFNHGVVIVGYGREKGQDYWLVKNSWGATWGSRGYIKMARNRGNHCGIASRVSYPIL